MGEMSNLMFDRMLNITRCVCLIIVATPLLANEGQTPPPTGLSNFQFTPFSEVSDPDVYCAQRPLSTEWNDWYYCTNGDQYRALVGVHETDSQDGYLEDSEGNRFSGPHGEDALLFGRWLYQWSDGSVYVGHVENDDAHGYGIYTSSDGTIYEGLHIDGALANGKITYASGWVYEGQLQNGKFSGFGSYISPEGARYEGNLVDNLPSGFGRLTPLNGDIYEGDWLAGNRHGVGTITYNNGDVYEGDWLNDQRHGFGTYTYNSGSVYEGDWLNDQKHGFGTYTYNNGDVYEGDWLNNQKHGFGTYTYNNGDVYAGAWADNNPTGAGFSSTPTPKQTIMDPSERELSADTQDLEVVEIDPATLAPGELVIQLGAFSNRDAALRKWDMLAVEHNQLFEGRSRLIMPPGLGSPEFFRLRVAGFDGLDDAISFCRALLALGQACIPASIR